MIHNYFIHTTHIIILVKSFFNLCNRKIRFVSSIQFRFRLSSYDSAAAGISSTFIGTGDTRGDLFIAKFYYKLSPNVTGHVLFEHFIPGNYYFDGANVSNWARLEVMYSL